MSSPNINLSALDARYISLPGKALRYSGIGMVAIGDSITNLNSAGATNGVQVTDMHFDLGLIYSNQVPQWRGVFATDGYTLAQIQTTHLPSVLAMSPLPAACLILGGTNDIQQGGFTVAGSLATLKAMCDALVAVGVQPVAATLPPWGASGAIQNNCSAYNRALKQFAASNGYDLVDYHKALTNPATGSYKTNAARQDTVHPSYSGAKLMGQALSVVLNKLPFPQVSAPLADDITDSTNLLGSYGSFQVDSNSDGIADGWSNLGLAGGTASVTVDADGTKWQKITLPSTGSGNALLQRTLTGIGAVNDVIEVCARIRTTGFDSTLQPSNSPSSGGVGAAWSLHLDFTSAASPYNQVHPAHLIHTDISDGIIYARGKIGTGGTGNATLTILVYGAPPSGTVTYEITSIAVRNLTALNLQN